MRYLQYHDLHDTEKFVLIESFKHTEMKEFLSGKKDSPKYTTYWIYLAMLMLLFSLFSGVLTWSVLKLFEGYGKWFVQIGYAVIFAFTVLIPVHEIFHAIAYRLTGAKNIYFGVVWKKFVFYAASDKDVVNGRQYYFIAIFPFIMITTFSIAVLLIDLTLLPFFCTVIFFNALFSGGDFLLINLISAYKLNEVYTYDDRLNGSSYIYLVK